MYNPFINVSNRILCHEHLIHGIWDFFQTCIGDHAGCVDGRKERILEFSHRALPELWLFVDFIDIEYYQSNAFLLISVIELCKWIFFKLDVSSGLK
jgi:hypothetical protein